MSLPAVFRVSDPAWAGSPWSPANDTSTWASFEPAGGAEPLFRKSAPEDNRLEHNAREDLVG